jgi:hypothetical protein
VGTGAAGSGPLPPASSFRLTGSSLPGGRVSELCGLLRPLRRAPRGPTAGLTAGRPDGGGTGGLDRPDERALPAEHAVHPKLAGEPMGTVVQSGRDQ